MLIRSFVGALVIGLMAPAMSSAQEPAASPSPSQSTAAASPSQSTATAQEPVTKEDMKLAAEKDLAYGSETSFLTWHGYMDMEFFKQPEVPSSFDLHEVYLSTKAQIAKQLSVTAEFEYEHGGSGLILPMQAYADYAANPALTIRTGIFYVPIGLPRAYTLRGNKNRMIRQNALTHDLMFENWAEMGVDIFGEFKSGLFYDVAVANGMPNTMAPGDSWKDAQVDDNHDNNDNKAVFFHGGYNGKGTYGQVNIAGSYAAQTYDPDGERMMKHAGVDARYLHPNGFRIQTEYMKRSGDDNPADLENGIAAAANGWVFQTSKRVLFNNRKSFYEPVFQIDSIDLNEHTDTNGDKITSAIGFLLSPVEHYLLKTEYDFVSERHGAPIKNNKFWAAVVAEF